MFHALIRYRNIVFASMAAFGLLGLGLDALAPTARSATARIELAPGSEPLVFGTFHTRDARVRVEPVPGTRQVALRVEHPVPEVALMIANRVIRDYVEGRRPPGPSRISPRQRNQMARLAKLEAESRAIEGRQEAVAARLGAMAAFLRETSPDWKNLEVRSGRLAERRRQILRVTAQREKARKVYREKHPKVLALDRRLLELNAVAWGELQRVLVTENARQKALGEREIALRAEIVAIQQALDPASSGAFSDGTQAPEAKAAMAHGADAKATTVNAVAAKATVKDFGPRAIVVSEPEVTPWTLRHSGVFALCVYLTAGLLAGASIAVALESHRDMAEALAGGEGW